MLPDKDVFEKSILITARMQFFNPKHLITRRCLIKRDKPVFTELIEAMEKLFGDGIKICPASFYYLDPIGERVTFSTDEELAIAFYLTNRELKIGIAELQSADGVSLIKVENPSINSSAVSLEQSFRSQSQSQYSTPTVEYHQMTCGSRSHRRNHIRTLTSGTPTLYKSKIVPKISSRLPVQNSSCIMSKTFTKREPNITSKELRKRRNKSYLDCGDFSGDEVKDCNTSNLSNDKDVLRDDGDKDINIMRKGLFSTVNEMMMKLCLFLFPMIMRAVRPN